MREIFIIDAVRTAAGRRNGALSQVHPVDLAAEVLAASVERSGVPADQVDDVVLGCVLQIGGQSANIARNAWLSAGLPEEVPAVTVDRQCGSSQQAITFAAQGVASGAFDLAIGAGVEVLSLITLNSAWELGPSLGFRSPWDGKGWQERYGDVEIHQFRAGEDIARHWGISRAEQDAFALESHAKAIRATDEGRFAGQIHVVDGAAVDECIRRDMTAEKLAEIAPLREGGTVTGGSSSKLADCAAAVMLASADAVERYHLTPIAKIHTSVAVGSDPVMMLTGPIPATAKVLDRAGLALKDIELFECNEAFGAVVLAWARETGVDLAKVNVNGGAIALGHPLGATGARIMTTLVHELRRTGGRYGLQTICEGGGLANATVVEAL
ncbi:MAG TPA: acetyl-CoA C-acyltransferase [Solirubrobacterales bacterium]|nr:acetyl-CoA C-acyltransferase [Solirubrobacterales bacterium]